jgi:hypothetical protein
MHLSKLVHSNTGKYIMSIILGIGVATLFRVTCIGNDCKIFRAPPLDEIEDKIYSFDKKCYKMDPKVATCDSNKKIYEFA